MNKDQRRKEGGKLGPVTKPCVLVGINPHGPGWLLLDASSNREVPSSDVVFQEDVPFYKRRADRGEEHQFNWFIFDDDHTPSPSPPEQNHPPTPQVQVPEPLPATPPVPPTTPQAQPLPAPLEDLREITLNPLPPTQEPQALRRSRRAQGLQPEVLPQSNLRWQGIHLANIEEEFPATVHAFVQVIVGGESGDKKKEIPVPKSVEEALGGDHGGEWMESMISEYTGIQKTGTLEPVPRSKAKNVVKCKWVYRIKRRPDGQPHFKSRLVAKGFSQKEGVDFFETWAPTARHTTARVFLHLAAIKDMEIHAMDVDQAFLQGDLEEEIFMEPAPAMPKPPGEDSVWRLKKPLYGLKQAPRQWHAKLKVVLLQMSFKPSHSDPSLYIGQSSTGSWLLVYVDDLLMACKDVGELSRFKSELKKHFPMKDLGEVTTYLGMELVRDRDTNTISLTQQKYVGELVKKFGLQNTKAASTPLQVNHGLSPQGRRTCHPQPGTIS